MKKFENVPVDLDTRIKQEEIIEVGGIPALYQQWSWEGLIAESIIFYNEDVEDLSDEDLFELISYHADPDGQYTVSRKGAVYTFINFNFRD